MTTPADEAAAILIRMFETLAAAQGKRLKEQHRAEIRRACELLSADGALEPLEDVARVTPAEAAVSLVTAAEADPNYRKWRQEKRER
jgi:hypothetical protein